MTTKPKPGPVGLWQHACTTLHQPINPHHHRCTSRTMLSYHANERNCQLVPLVLLPLLSSNTSITPSVDELALTNMSSGM